MVLDLTSGRLSDAIVHAEKALQSIEARVTELKDGLSGQLKPESRGQGTVDTKDSVKGKGKAVGGKLVRDDLVQNMTKVQIEGELKELEGLKEDLGLKVCLGFDITMLMLIIPIRLRNSKQHPTSLLNLRLRWPRPH